jgi:hypothetical protein
MSHYEPQLDGTFQMKWPKWQRMTYETITQMEQTTEGKFQAVCRQVPYRDARMSIFDYPEFDLPTYNEHFFMESPFLGGDWKDTGLPMQMGEKFFGPGQGLSPYDDFYNPTLGLVGTGTGRLEHFLGNWKWDPAGTGAPGNPHEVGGDDESLDYDPNDPNAGNK